ncbi:MAG: hypothetical protein WC989_07220 [Micavibrio sp.]
MVTEIKNGKGDPCRDKASKYIRQINEKFPIGENDKARFDAFLELYNRAAAGVERVRENFESDHWKRFEKDPGAALNQATALNLAMAHREGVIIMREACREMGKLPPAGINGTSVEFAKCQALCRVEEKNLKSAAKIIQEKILDTPPPPANDSSLKIPVRILEAFPSLMLIAEVVAA